MTPIEFGYACLSAVAILLLAILLSDFLDPR